MTDQQLYLALGAPMLFNAVLIGLLMVYMNAEFAGVDKRFDACATFGAPSSIASKKCSRPAANWTIADGRLRVLRPIPDSAWAHGTWSPPAAVPA
jgi:hypothetical protein